MYHRFPKDSGLRKAWKNACHRAESFDPTGLYICETHFSSDCYEKDLKASLMANEDKKKLKPGSIPSKYLVPSYKSP